MFVTQSLNQDLINIISKVARTLLVDCNLVVVQWCLVDRKCKTLPPVTKSMVICIFQDDEQ